MNVIEDLPKNWAIASVGDVCSQPQYGYTTKASDRGDLRLLRTSDITSGRINWETVPYCSDNPDDLEKYIVEDGDILVSRAGSVGVSYLVTKPLKAVFASYLIRFKPFIDRQFLAYFLQSPDYWVTIADEKLGIAVPNVNATKLKSITLPLPPTAEQHRIVAKIEELFSALDKGVESLKTARAKLNVYRQAVLKHAFEGKLTAQWREENKDKFEKSEQLLARIKRERAARYERQLKEWKAAVKEWEAEGMPGKKPSKPRKPILPDKPRSDQLDRMWKVPPTWQWLQVGNFAFVTKLAGFEYTKFVEYDDDGDLPVIKAENAGRNGFRATRYSRVKSESVGHLTRSYLEGSELLMVFVGAGTGNVATVPRDQAYFLGPNIGMIRPETQAIKTRYVEFFLRSPMGKQLALASVKAVAQPSLSMGTIRQIPVILPSTEEQSEIVQQLDNVLSAIDAIEAEIDGQLLKADALRQSILKKAFSGQLVPQDPHDEPASVLLDRIRAERERAAKNNHSKKTKRKKAAA